MPKCKSIYIANQLTYVVRLIRIFLIVGGSFVIIPPYWLCLEENYLNTESPWPFVTDFLVVNPETTIVIKFNAPVSFPERIRIKILTSNLILVKIFEWRWALQDNLYSSGSVVGAIKKDRLAWQNDNKESDAIKLFEEYFVISVAYFDE